jgi:hypothetical protein
MDLFLGGLAFAALLAAQLFAVIAVNRARLEQSGLPLPAATDARPRIIWESGF